jgi:signal transduction histidine kinase
MQLVVQSLQHAHARGAEISPTLLLGLLENVERQTRRLARLVDELLDVSRIQAGRLQLVLEPVDLVAVCHEVIARFATEAARSGSTVELHADTPATGMWDRSRIDQVVSNLLSNAVKYGAGRPIELIVRADESGARLVVRDRGVGIAPELLGRLFRRFERASSARHYGGLGLGLFIVRQIVEMHGGTVAVTSEPNVGSTFTVMLPIRPR